MTQSAIDQYRDSWDRQDISTVNCATTPRVCFSVALEEMEAKRIEEKFWIEDKDNPAAERALKLISRRVQSMQQRRTNGHADQKGT